MGRQLFQIEDREGMCESLIIKPRSQRYDVSDWQLASPSVKRKLYASRAKPSPAQSARSVIKLAELLDLLLVPDMSPSAPQIWKDYVSHLALKLMQLYLTRQPMDRSTGDVFASRRSHQFSNLSTYLRPIIHAQPDFLAPLDHTLGNLAVALCKLFPPASGRVRLYTEGLSLPLPGLCHRVVSAIGLELLLNVLQHGFFSGASGDVYVVVGQDSAHEGFLLVADNGRGLGSGAPGEGFRLINHLAGLIGGETVLRRTGAKGTEVEARFRIPLR